MIIINRGMNDVQQILHNVWAKSKHVEQKWFGC